jgi:hypothetical protein
VTDNELSDELNRCDSCRRLLGPAELGRRACFNCQDDVARNLAELAGSEGLYAALSDALNPNTKGQDGMPRPASKEKTLGVRMDTLELLCASAGSDKGVPGKLIFWVLALAQADGRKPPTWSGSTAQAIVDAAAQHLRFHLEAIAYRDGWAVFAGDIQDLVFACRAAIGEGPERKHVVGFCQVELGKDIECGGKLRYNSDTNVTVCATCHDTADVDWETVRQAALGEAA